MKGIPDNLIKKFLHNNAWKWFGVFAIFCIYILIYNAHQSFAEQDENEDIKPDCFIESFINQMEKNNIKVLQVEDFFHYCPPLHKLIDKEKDSGLINDNKVNWITDYNKAIELSKITDKPILIYFVNEKDNAYWTYQHRNLFSKKEFIDFSNNFICLYIDRSNKLFYELVNLYSIDSLNYWSIIDNELTMYMCRDATLQDEKLYKRIDQGELKYRNLIYEKPKNKPGEYSKWRLWGNPVKLGMSKKDVSIIAKRIYKKLIKDDKSGDLFIIYPTTGNKYKVPKWYETGGQVYTDRHFYGSPKREITNEAWIIDLGPPRKAYVFFNKKGKVDDVYYTSNKLF